MQEKPDQANDGQNTESMPEAESGERTRRIASADFCRRASRKPRSCPARKTC